MGALLDQIMPNMIREFKLGYEDNVDIIEEKDTGLSGAEVYLLELKGTSLYRGKYYLKLDKKKEGTAKKSDEVKFNNVAQILESSVIDNIYVTLMQVAGNSCINYKPFHEIESTNTREEAMRIVLPKILDESIANGGLVVDKSMLPQIAQRMLGDKLNEERSIAQYLDKVTAGKSDSNSTKSFFYKNEGFPNAYKYAIESKNTDEIYAYDIPSCNHGDFHDNNLLYSEKEKNYALIDLELYKKNGYLFYDTAYMELSILLHNMGMYELRKWNHVIMNLAQENWAYIDCIDKRVFKAIADEEYKWIEKQITCNCSYKDELTESRHIARMMVGLNFAGKRNVTWEVFQRAFIYACFHLRELFNKRGYNDWREGQHQWPAVLNSKCDVKNSKGCGRLLGRVESFNALQKYIMILGDNFDTDSQTVEGLDRIAWTGILSFSIRNDFEKWWRDKRTINVIKLNGNVELLDADNLWLIYANGVAYEPETIIENFVDWRNKTRRFLDRISERIQEEIAPDDIEFIVDLGSFSIEGKKRLKKVCEIFDTVENADMHMSILSNDLTDINEFVEICNNMEFDVYDMSLDVLAAYCCEYMQGKETGQCTIPGKNNRRIFVPSELLSKTPPHTELLHSKIVSADQYVSEKEAYGFFCGEKISWQAIRDYKWIELEAYNRIEKKTCDLVENGANGSLIVDVPYSPGAGASVMCRVLAWRMRVKYPTIIVYSLHRMLMPFLQKLYSLSGKCVLLFLDGDFSYSEVKNIERQMYYAVTKVCIIYFHRDYSQQFFGVDKNVISYLDGDTALNFARIYSSKMSFLMDYDKDVIELRQKRMNELATHVELIQYRLPFFFGVSAFETDFKGIDAYINQILTDLRQEEKIGHIVTYIALITFYTNGEGMKLSYVKRLIKKYLSKDELSSKTVLNILNSSKHRLVYFVQGTLRICHPIIAKKIITEQYNVSSTLFINFIKEFISDICACEFGATKSNAQKGLLAGLFLSRNIEGIVENGNSEWKKQRFSQLIMDIGNPNQQEQVFKYLTEKIPDNAHFWQHYGRLVIENHPESLEKAKELFDKAIELEPKNSIHFHARGEMYKKHIRFICNQFKNDGIVGLYNHVGVLTENAINDYQMSINLIHKNKTDELSLVYPYSSLINIVTYVVNKLYQKNEIGVKNEKEFLLMGNKISNWCKKIIYIAQRIRLQTVVRYDALNRDEFFQNACTYLVRYTFTPNEIEAQIDKNPNDTFLLHSYMHATVCKMNEWPEKPLAQLKRIRDVSSRLILSPKENSEGVMWQWFNASLYDKEVDLSEIVGLLETLHDSRNNMSAQFMLYMIKLGDFLNTGNNFLVNEILDHMKRCRELSDNSQRKSIRYYYCGDKAHFGFSANIDHACVVDGMVSQWTSFQNGRISLDKDARLKVFFVPSSIGMNEDGAVGTKVSFILGVSFDGLRSHSVSISSI